MWYKYVLMLFLLLGQFVAEGQTSKAFFDSVIKNEDQRSKKPLAYAFVDPSDVVWCKTVWRELVLREKINLPLYYPTEPMDGRMSLIDVLLKGVEKSFKNAFEDDELQVPVSYDEIRRKFDAGSDTLVKRNSETGELMQVVSQRDINSSEVKRLQIKELWYFNKRTSRLEVRIIAICPIREYVKDDIDGIQKRMLFWVDYDEFRDLFSHCQVYNFQNDAGRLSLDDVFLKRYFSSRIIKDTNPYNNRSIQSYALGIDVVLESDRIKNEMFNFEQDLWEY